jgi:hypothetical protein
MPGGKENHMLNERLAAARAVKGRLLPAETSIDVALEHLGQLIATACRARIDAGLPPHLGQDALTQLTTATAMMSEIRGRVISAHSALVEDGRTFLPATGVGDVGDCPSQASAEQDAPRKPLRAVA